MYQKEPSKLNENIYELTATLLACGIDAEKSPIFLQSTVPQHSELCWILSCLCTMNRLSHLPQFKEKSALVKDIQTGLFLYPVLQAADILVHRFVLCMNRNKIKLLIAYFKVYLIFIIERLMCLVVRINCNSFN